MEGPLSAVGATVQAGEDTIAPRCAWLRISTGEASGALVVWASGEVALDPDERHLVTTSDEVDRLVGRLAERLGVPGPPPQPPTADISDRLLEAVRTAGVWTHDRFERARELLGRDPAHEFDDWEPGDQAWLTVVSDGGAVALLNELIPLAVLIGPLGSLAPELARLGVVSIHASHYDGRELRASREALRAAFEIYAETEGEDGELDPDRLSPRLLWSLGF